MFISTGLLAELDGFFSILLTHEGSHREAYRDFQPSLTSSAGGAKGCSDHRLRAPPAYTSQLPTLHQHRASNQYRTANQIQPIKGLAATLRQHLNCTVLIWLSEIFVVSILKFNVLSHESSQQKIQQPILTLQSNSYQKNYQFLCVFDNKGIFLTFCDQNIEKWAT